MTSIIVPYLQSRAVPLLELYPTAFNNIAIQVVDRNISVPDAFWVLPLHVGMDGVRESLSPTRLQSSTPSDLKTKTNSNIDNSKHSQDEI